MMILFYKQIKNIFNIWQSVQKVVAPHENLFILQIFLKIFYNYSKSCSITFLLKSNYSKILKEFKNNFTKSPNKISQNKLIISQNKMIIIKKRCIQVTVCVVLNKLMSRHWPLN